MRRCISSALFAALVTLKWVDGATEPLKPSLSILAVADVSAQRFGDSRPQLETLENSYLELGISGNPSKDQRLRLTTEIREVDAIDAAGGRHPQTLVAGLLSLSGPLGSMKVGRAFTAAQEALYAFEPFEFVTIASVLAITGNYVSDPRYGGSTAYQYDNGIYLSTARRRGLQLSFSMTDRERVAPGAQSPATPFSLACTLESGSARAMIGWERGLNGDRLANLSAGRAFSAVDAMATYSRYLPVVGGAQNSLTLGAILSVRPGSTLRLGFGMISGSNTSKEYQLSGGYWYEPFERLRVYGSFSRFSIDGAATHAVEAGVRYAIDANYPLQRRVAVR